MCFRSTLAAGVIFCGLIAGTAAVQAAPAIHQPGLAGGDRIETVAMHHHRMHRHQSTRHERRMRRMNTMRHGNPNARNAAQAGKQQQLGSTTNGPRY